MFVYHGTNQANAMAILKEGFKKGTYFTPYLDSALVFGGEYVFAVWLEGERIENWGEDRWQFVIPEPWGPGMISALVHHQCEMLFVRDNYKKDACPRCKGTGELMTDDRARWSRQWLPKTHFIHAKSLIESELCPECHGHGKKREEKFE
ncbi:MAG: hypothetical protein J6Y62_04490 [Clostridia bacterium]|nr:hypothetical protein [Clostridia bacterium]